MLFSLLLFAFFLVFPTRNIGWGGGESSCELNFSLFMRKELIEIKME